MPKEPRVLQSSSTNPNPHPPYPVLSLSAIVTFDKHLDSRFVCRFCIKCTKLHQSNNPVLPAPPPLAIGSSSRPRGAFPSFLPL